MKACPKCGAQIEENARFCLYCMTALESKTIITANIKLKKRWPYIIAAVLVFVIVAFSISFPFIKDKSPNNSVAVSHKTESVIEINSSTVVNSEPSSSIISSTSKASTSQQSAFSSKETKSTNSSKNNSSKASSSTGSSKNNNSASQSSTSSKSSILDYLLFREYKTNAYLIEGHKEGISEKVILPNTYKGLPIRCIAAMSFIDCNISSVYIPSNVEFISDNAFYRCALTEVQFSEGLQKILCGAFADCKNLKTVVLPDSLLILGDMVFQGCSNLTSVSIGKNTTEILQDSFSNCDNLKHVYYRGTEADREKLIISPGNDALLSATWHYES